MYCLATSGWFAPTSYRGEREREGHSPFLHVFSTPVILPAQLESGTYTLPDLKRFLAEGLRSLKVPTLAIEYREVVESGGYSWVAKAVQLLTDLQCIMKYFCCLLQLPLLPVSVYVKEGGGGGEPFRMILSTQDMDHPSLLLTCI